MKDLDKFPTMERHLRGHSLSDKDSLASYRLNAPDKGGGKSNSVESSCANITKKPRYNTLGQGHSRVNPKNGGETANGSMVSKKCENLQRAGMNEKESKHKEKAVMVEKAKTCCVKNQDQKLNQIRCKLRKGDEKSKESGVGMKGLQREDKYREHSKGKEGKGGALCNGGREKGDREKKNKEEIDRKNLAKQSQLRSRVTKETSPKELVCCCDEKASSERKLMEPKHIETRSYTKDEDNKLIGNKMNMLGTILSKNQSMEGPLCSYLQPISSMVKLVQQNSKGNQLHRQKSAEEHMGDLGNLVGDVLSLLLPHRNSSCALEKLHPEEEEEEEDSLYRPYDVRKSLALKETVGHNGTKSSTEETGFGLKEVGMKQWSEKESESDCEKDLQESPNALMKWMSELQKTLEITESRFQELQESFCTLKAFVSDLEKQTVPNDTLKFPAVTSLVKNMTRRKRGRKRADHPVIQNREKENLPDMTRRKRGRKREDHPVIQNREKGNLPNMLIREKGNFPGMLNRWRGNLPAMSRRKRVRKSGHLPGKPSRRRLWRRENHPEIPRRGRRPNPPASDRRKRSWKRKNYTDIQRRKTPWKRENFTDMPRRKRQWKRKDYTDIPRRKTPWKRKNYPDIPRKKRPWKRENYPEIPRKKRPWKRENYPEIPRKKRPWKREYLPPLYTASTAQSSLPINGRGDKSVQEDPVDSDGSTHRKGKSSNEDLSEKENRNNDDEKDRDEKEDLPFGDRGPNKLSRGPSIESSLEDSMVDPNYKYRRKHGQLQNGQRQLADFLGLLSSPDQDIPPDLTKEIKGFVADINPCLVICLKRQTGNDFDPCEICTCVMTLTSHFGRCNSEMHTCKFCLQLFRLVQQHVLLCRTENTSAQCPVLVCRKISFLINEDPNMIFTKEAKIWRKLKKYIGGFIQRREMVENRGDDGETCFSMTSLTSINPTPGIGLPGPGGAVNPPAPPKVHRPSHTYMPSLTIIHEDQDRSLNVPECTEQPPTDRVSRSEPILRKKPDGTIETLKPLLFQRSKIRPLRRYDSADKIHPPSPMVTGPPPSFTIPTKGEAKVARKVSFKEEGGAAASLKKALDVEADAFPESVAVESDEQSEPGSLSIPSEPSSLELDRVYGTRYISVGERSHLWHFGEAQFLSLKEKPFGNPGIGEVVYGLRDILLEVLQFWDELKLQYKEYGKLLNKSVKEEGVIYPDCKKQLMIMGHRYQKDFQWVRVVHLGRGMFGNCHLATDYNTDYQFCIKKIHISKYRSDEIKIWSDLDHPNVVKFHGVLRRKEKIYIIAEFIPGGNLTEVINAQKTLMRRLSQRKALQLFHQLLVVLVYLEKKAVIHEDIKSDNILLREDGREIVLADFGFARRQTTKVSTLVGTPTHFSPEKAESRGHDFKSDLWAACCVLLHILSGDPPWVKRYPNATALHFLIATQPAPLDDVPKNIHRDVRSLIEKCLEKTPSNRPVAKALLQHPAFQLINESGDNMYSILPSGGLTLDDTRLPSTRQTETTEEILKEIQEQMFPSVTLRDDLTGILGKSTKVEDLPDASHTAKSRDDHPQKQSNIGEITNKDSTFPFTGNTESSIVEAKSREDSFLASIKRSAFATQREILEESQQDYTKLIVQYLDDDDPLVNFPFPEQALYNPPLYLDDTPPTSQASPEDESTGGDQQFSGTLNIPKFDLFNDPNQSEENTDIERLHEQALQEQLSKTSSNLSISSDLLMPMYPSSQHSGSSGEFNQDKIIQTLIEEPENRSGSSSRSRSRSSSRSEETRRSSQSNVSEFVFNLLPKSEDPHSTSIASNNTIGGNLPNSILFDFDLKSKSTDSYHTPAEEIAEGSGKDIEEEEKKVGEEEEEEEEELAGSAGVKKTPGQEGSRSHSEEDRGEDQENRPGLSSKMIPFNLGLEPRRSPNSTMFDEYDKNISDDDLFADSYKSEELNKSKSESSVKSSSSANLSSQETLALVPIMPFTIEKDPQDPNKQMVVLDKDPSKAIPPPRTFKKAGKPSQLNFRKPTKPRENPSKRLSNPEVGRPYTPLTPQKYYTPPVNHYKPFTLATPTSGYHTSTPTRSVSPKEREQDEEYEKLIRDLSHHSEEPISGLENDENQPVQGEDQPSLTEEEQYKYSLHFVLENYITETDDKCVKVDVEKLDGEHFITKLPFEYSSKPWKNFVEENFNMMKTRDIDMLTLHFLDGVALDLQEKPIDSHQNYRVLLKVVEVTEHGRDDLLWYCQNGICRVGGGIPV